MNMDYSPSGDYDGADAPWNQKLIKCPICEGKGFFYYRQNAHTEDEERCSEDEYAGLPGTPDEAIRQGKIWCRADVGMERCPACEGDGRIDAREEEEILWQYKRLRE